MEQIVKQFFQVDKKISLITSNKIALLLVTVFILLLGVLASFQPTSKVF